MPYVPIKAPVTRNMRRYSSISPVKGVNNRVFSALLSPQDALVVQNYIPDAEGKLDMRKGRSDLFSIVGVNGFDFYIRFTSDTFIFAYGTTVAAYNENTGVITNIKTDFSANDGFVGVRYGEYFFVVNGVEKMWRIDAALTITEVASSPVMKKIFVVANRLAGVLASDPTQLRYSEVDTGSNPPFTTWSNSTTATDGGQVGYRNAGEIHDVLYLGNVFICLCDYGKWGFTIDQSDVGGSVNKIDQDVFSNQDLGGFKGIVTEKGIYYVNEGAIMNLISVGQPNIPYSKQENNIAYVLGKSFFENADFSEADLAYDDTNEILMIAYRTAGTSVNNKFLIFNTNTGAFASFTNWPIKSLYVDFDGAIYGTSSVSNTVYRLFDGYDDGGQEISTMYYQEMTGIGDFNTAKDLIKFMAQTSLSTSSLVTFSFDIWDYYNVFQANVHSYCMSLQNQPEQADGYGEISYGSGGYGGNPDENDMTIGSYDTYKPMIRNFQRIFLRVTSSGVVPHTINMFMAEVKEKGYIRIRNIVQCN